MPFIGLEWRPNDQWTVAALRGVTNSLEIEYKPLLAYAFTGVSQENEQYLRADRADNDDVLTFNEWRAGAGIRTGLPPSSAGRFVLDIFGGVAFDREISEFADEDERDDNRITTDNALIITSEIGWLF